MPIFQLCKFCKDFTNMKTIHEIKIAERDYINFQKCPECDHVQLSHDKWTEEDEL
jgi:hypothetical protein